MNWALGLDRFRLKVTEEKSRAGTSNQLLHLGELASWLLWGLRAARLASGPPDSKPVKGSLRITFLLGFRATGKTKLSESLVLLPSPSRLRLQCLSKPCLATGHLQVAPRKDSPGLILLGAEQRSRAKLPSSGPGFLSAGPMGVAGS